MNKFFILLVFALLLVQCNYISTQASSVQSNSKEYVDTAKKFSIIYPEKWDKREIREFDLDIVVLVPPEIEEGLMHERMTIIYSKVEGVETLENFVAASIDHLKEVISDFKVEETTDVELANAKAKRVIYSDVAGKYNLKFMQYFILYKDRLYILTCSADAPEFDQYKSEFEAIAKSFKVLD